jgi:hypothetical protein
MKLLFDENLSHKLVSRLADLFPDSVHVRDIGLKAGDDAAVWDYAKSNGLMIVSKDSERPSSRPMDHGGSRIKSGASLQTPGQSQTNEAPDGRNEPQVPRQTAEDAHHRQSASLSALSKPGPRTEDQLSE